MKLLNAPEAGDPEDERTPYEKRSQARQGAKAAQAGIDQADAAIADQQARIAALDSLGRDEVPIHELALEIAKTP